MNAPSMLCPAMPQTRSLPARDKPFPADFDDIEAIKYVMDRAVYLGEPRLDGQALHFSAEIQGVICNVAIR